MGPMILRPYQEDAVDFWRTLKFVYFAIDMGLGKTAIALHLINMLNLPTLVVAPLKVTYNTWPDEIKDWGLQADVSIDILHGPKKLERFKQGAQVHAINYESLPWLYETLYELHKAGKPMPYKALVLDESTFIKDPSSKRFGLLCAMRDMFTHIACLSGTPAPNSLLDLWAQYYLLDKGKSLGPKFNGFRQKFFKRNEYNKFSWDIRFGAETVIHKAVADRTFMLASSDHISLPDRVYNRISLDLPSKERKMYKSFKKDFVLFLDSAEIESLNKASLSSKLRQFVQGAIYENFDSGGRETHYIHDIKVRALRQSLESLHGKNVICFVQFQFEVEMLLKSFPGTPFITGATKESDSNEYIRQWKAGELPLLIAHPKSIGRGLNLQSGGYNAIWFALPWSLDDYQQANKRLHRSGQENTVVIHHLIMRDTIDENVVEALNMKDMTQKKLLEYLRQKTKEVTR